MLTLTRNKGVQRMQEASRQQHCLSTHVNWVAEKPKDPVYPVGVFPHVRPGGLTQLEPPHPLGFPPSAPGTAITATSRTGRHHLQQRGACTHRGQQ